MEPTAVSRSWTAAKLAEARRKVEEDDLRFLDFCDDFVAVTAGYDSAEEYKRATSSYNAIDRVAVPVLAVARMLRSARDVLPDEHHHHYTGPVHQEQHHTHTTTRGVWAKTTNQH